MDFFLQNFDSSPKPFLTLPVVIEKHMIVCGGFVKMYTGFQMVGYGIGTGIAMFFFPQ